MALVVVSVHVVVCVLLILVVLLQAGKGTGMGSALGGSSQVFIDSGSANGILSKATTMAAVIFMLTSLTMGYMRGKSSDSIMDRAVVQESKVEVSSDINLLDNDFVDETILEEGKDASSDTSNVDSFTGTK